MIFVLLNQFTANSIEEKGGVDSMASTSTVSSLPFRTEDVLNLMGYQVNPNRKSVYIKCPFCKSSNKPLNVDLRSSFYRCNKNPQHAGNILSFYADYFGMTNKEAYRDIIQKLNISDAAYTPPKPVEKVKEYEFDEEKSDKVFRRILARSYLSKKDFESLLKRGFSEEDIKRVGYKTLPERDGREIFEFTQSLGISDLSGVPGTFISKKGYWMLYHGKRGIIVPYHSFFNKIHGMQIRKHNDVLEYNDGKPEDKFYYLSSRYKQNGTAASQVAHYAGKFVEDDAGEHFDVSIGTLVLIEGGMKADLFYSLTGQQSMAIPGVHCINLLKKELPILKKFGLHTILIGYDMDRMLNINVLEALTKIEQLIKEYDISVKNLSWNTAYINNRGSANTLDTEKGFVFTPKSIKKAIEETGLDDILTRVQQCHRNRIYFALTNKEELSDENRSLFNLLKRTCEKYPQILHLECIFWELKLKGIDDYYAYKLKNIVP